VASFSGEKILDVVPDQDSLTIEAQIAVEDISDIRLNDVIHADRLTDPTQSLLCGDCRVDEGQLAGCSTRRSDATCGAAGTGQQRENRLPDLAPERGFIAAKPFENSTITSSGRW